MIALLLDDRRSSGDYGTTGGQACAVPRPSSLRFLAGRSGHAFRFLALSRVASRRRSRGGVHKHALPEPGAPISTLASILRSRRTSSRSRSSSTGQLPALA
jgi:hypothetical protein